jgi:Ca2+-binding EF-hand superfamily protein
LYFVMVQFYIAYLRQEKFPQFLGFPESFPQIGKPVICEESCLAQLQIKLFIVFAGKTYMLKVLEYGKPMLRMWLRVRNAGKRETKAATAPPGDVKHQSAQEAEAEAEREKLYGRALTVEEQANLEPWGGVFQDFSQMVIQFGYIALFAPACSLAPLLALINNITEIRSDAIKVCTMYQRPTWRSIPSIGAWGEVVQALAVAAVLVNATMICFVGTELTDGSAFQREGIGNRVRIPELWVYCLLMEHGVLMLRVALQTLSPDHPRWVEEAKDTLDWTVARMENESAGGRTPGTDMGHEFKQQSKEERKDTRELFDQLDVDGSGSLDREEIRELCQSCGFNLKDADLDKQMREMDADADGTIIFDEFQDWWAMNCDKNVYQLRDPRDVFTQVDADANGLLGPEEVQNLCTKLGMKQLGKKNLRQMFADMDSDGDGVVTIEEFCFWWSTNGARRYRPARPPGPGDPSTEAQVARAEAKKQQITQRREERRARQGRGMAGSKGVWQGLQGAGQWQEQGQRGRHQPAGSRQASSPSLSPVALEVERQGPAAALVVSRQPSTPGPAIARTSIGRSSSRELGGGGSGGWAPAGSVTARADGTGWGAHPVVTTLYGHYPRTGGSVATTQTFNPLATSSYGGTSRRGDDALRATGGGVSGRAPSSAAAQSQSQSQSQRRLSPWERAARATYALRAAPPPPPPPRPSTGATTALHAKDLISIQSHLV